MSDHPVDVAVLIAYFVATILVGLWVSRRGSKDLDSYFLGGKSLPWYMLGISDASGMFDISGTMLMVYWLFAYGLKSVWLPFLWPVFNQIFLMMFLERLAAAIERPDRCRVDSVSLWQRNWSQPRAHQCGRVRPGEHGRHAGLRL